MFSVEMTISIISITEMVIHSFIDQLIDFSLQSDKIVKIIRVQQATSHLTVNVIMLVFTLPKKLCDNTTNAGT